VARIRAPQIDALNETAAVEEASKLLDRKPLKFGIKIALSYVSNLQSGRNQARFVLAQLPRREKSARSPTEFDPPCARIGISSDPRTDKAQSVARGGQRLERVVDQREPAAKVRVVRVGCPVVFEKHWVVSHQ
jgi:hypothetical protein